MRASRPPSSPPPPRRPPVHANPHLLRTLDPLRLRLLLELERLGTITGAAEACSLAQPTASTHLRTLETAVGHRVYERAGRVTRLTDAGRLLAGHAKMVISSLEAFQDDLTALEGALTGTIRVAACETFGSHVLPEAIAELALDRPQAQIDVIVQQSGAVLRAVQGGEVHVGIAAPHRPMPGLQSEPLLRDRVVWLAPPGDSIPPVLDAERMQGLTLLVMGPESSQSTMTLTAIESAGYRPARLLRLDSVETIKRSVAAGVGVAALSWLAVAPELAAGQLREVRMQGVEPLERTFEMFTHEQRSPSALERMFHDILRVHCVALAARAAV